MNDPYKTAAFLERVTPFLRENGHVDIERLQTRLNDHAVRIIIVVFSIFTDQTDTIRIEYRHGDIDVIMESIAEIAELYR